MSSVRFGSSWRRIADGQRECSDKWALYHNLVHANKYLRVHELFEKYGPVVRTGPNTVTLANAEHMNTVYLGKWDKIEAYDGFRTHRGTPNSFSAVPQSEAQGKRRGMLPQYATSNLCEWQDVFEAHMLEMAAFLRKNGAEKPVDILSFSAHGLIDVCLVLLVVLCRGADTSPRSSASSSLIRRSMQSPTMPTANPTLSPQQLQSGPSVSLIRGPKGDLRADPALQEEPSRDSCIRCCGSSPPTSRTRAGRKFTSRTRTSQTFATRTLCERVPSSPKATCPRALRLHTACPPSPTR